MQFILRARHWQVFLILMLGFILSSFRLEGNPTATTILSVIGYLTYMMWSLLVGNELHAYVPEKISPNNTFFLVNGFISIASFLSAMIISSGEGMTFTGLEALPMFYVIYAMLYCISYPGRLLRTIENNKEATLGDYIGDFFLVLFLPIGIWFLQPRINKVVGEQEENIS